MSEKDTMLDARGLLCPEPIMLLHKKIRQLAPGAILTVIATDPSTERDIVKFCQFLEHELLSHEVKSGEYHYCIQKAKATE